MQKGKAISKACREFFEEAIKREKLVQRKQKQQEIGLIARKIKVWGFSTKLRFLSHLVFCNH